MDHDMQWLKLREFRNHGEDTRARIIGWTEELRITG